MTDSRAQDDVVPGSVYRTLLQLALLGTELGDHESSNEITAALSDLRTDLPQARIVFAMNSFSAGKAAQGIQELQATLEEFPDSQLGKAMLAVCLKLSERSGWQAMLESVIEDGRDEYAIGLACSILGRSNHTSEAPPAQTVSATPAHAMWA